MAPAVVVLSRVLQFMLVFLPGVCWTYEVVQSVEGSVAADETKHYTVDVVGVVVGKNQSLALAVDHHTSLPVALLTDEGDADLYASTVVKEPDYSNSQSSSCSCGLDLIVLATSKGVESEHVYLSVVGHAWHERSHYKLAIIAPSKNDITNYQVRVSGHLSNCVVFMVTVLNYSLRRWPSVQLCLFMWNYNKKFSCQR